MEFNLFHSIFDLFGMDIDSHLKRNRMKNRNIEGQMKDKRKKKGQRKTNKNMKTTILILFLKNILILSSPHIPKVPVLFHAQNRRWRGTERAKEILQCMLIMTAAHIFSDIWNSYNESKMLKIMEGISKIEPNAVHSKFNIQHSTFQCNYETNFSRQWQK